MIPYGKQSIDSSDLDSVLRALQSDWLTTGPQVKAFEQAFAQRTGARYAIAVCNGTAALHLAMLACGIGSGDRVYTSPNTFLASANAAAYVGAVPDFSDIDPVTYCLDPEVLEQNWLEDTRAIVAVDYAGQTAELPRLAELARSRNAFVIEDACHAIGGQFEHEKRLWPVGGHPYADVTTFSFHPVKSMTTGEGGMLVTDDREIAERARVLRNHGMTREPDEFQSLQVDGALAEQGPWYYEMHSLGYNYRITDFQSALGISQLQRLDHFLQRRREIVETYREAFAKLPHLQVPRLRNPLDQDVVAWHLFTILIDFEMLRTTRTEFMRELRESGVGSQVLYIPVHLQPWYRHMYGYGPGKCPVAESLYPQFLSLPLYPAMTDEDVMAVIENVTQLVLSHAE